MSTRENIRLIARALFLSWYSAYFSVTSIALNDVNVRGGSVIKPFAREICTGQKFVSL